MAGSSEVCLYVYGDKGYDGPLALGSCSDGEYFQCGQTDCFGQNIKDVGKWYKVRIGHNDIDRSAGWFLDDASIQKSSFVNFCTYNQF